MVELSKLCVTDFKNKGEILTDKLVKRQGVSFFTQLKKRWYPYLRK